MAYIVAIHIPIAGISLVPVVFNWPLILLPIHIVFMEIVVDPACSLVFESVPAEKDIMKHKPRSLNSPLFNRQTIVFSLKQGLISLTGILMVLLFAHFKGLAEGHTRALTFTTLVMVNMGLIFVNYSWSKKIWRTFKNFNKTFWSIQAMTLAFLLGSLYIPAVRVFFKFSPLTAYDLLLPLGVAIVCVLLFDELKNNVHEKPTTSA